MHSASTDEFIGIVLAGGRSSRMGTNKAFLEYKGKPLVRHMIDLLSEAGARDVWVSGSVAGYPCIPDDEMFAGPACAVASILKLFRMETQLNLLFVPVDMPALTAGLLRKLTVHKEGAYFEGWPLPAFLPLADVRAEDGSVRSLLDVIGARSLPVAEEERHCFKNLNTPEEWLEASA